MRPLRILDGYCGAGLVARGLLAAGFDVVGVDLVRQPHYPKECGFVQADFLSLDPRLLRWFDAIWVSPPCLRDTELHASARREQRAHARAETAHPDLIAPTREKLVEAGVPYVIENVEGARLIDPVILCGSMFSLGYADRGMRHHLERHRKFEASFLITPPMACLHRRPVIGVYGGHARRRAKSAGGRGTRDEWEYGHIHAMKGAMGIPHDDPLTGAEISQGIPPIYAEHVGLELRRHILSERRAA